MAVGDKFILTLFASVQDIGVYSMAVSFGLTQKLFLSAFESAWAPFYYATIREPDARRVFRVVTTYGVAVLALLTAGLSAVGRDAAQAMTHGFCSRPTIRDGPASRRHHLDGGRRVLPGHLPPDVDRPQHHEADAVLSGRDDGRGRRPTSASISC